MAWRSPSILPFLALFAIAYSAQSSAAPPERLRIVIETDAGGDPDDEQSLVRFLLYANEWDVQGIIASRPAARDGENKNPERTGLGIVRAHLRAYAECFPNLRLHDPRFPDPKTLFERTAPGYPTNGGDGDEGVRLLLAAVDVPDERPIWFCNWGTDDASAESSLKRALDLVRQTRGPEAYAKFKSRFRLSSADKFGAHTTSIDPPFALWVDTFRPPMDGKRWYHRFSALTATAGGFDVNRDVRTGHGLLGALYPLNTTHPQKEGDSMTFLYLIPTGMNDPQHPTWGSWAGRYGPNPDFPGRSFFWANQLDAWQGKTNRDNTLARWAIALQHDFAARLDWCIADDFKKANHRPIAVLNVDHTTNILELSAKSGDTVQLSSAGSSDPDGNAITPTWIIYTEAGSFHGAVNLSAQTGQTTSFIAPAVKHAATIHIILQLEDNGRPSLFAYRRAIISIQP